MNLRRPERLHVDHAALIRAVRLKLIAERPKGQLDLALGLRVLVPVLLLDGLHHVLDGLKVADEQPIRIHDSRYELQAHDGFDDRVRAVLLGRDASVAVVDAAVVLTRVATGRIAAPT